MMKQEQITPDDLDRFWSKVEKTDTCWYWTAYKRRRGYGSFYFQNKLVYAHRFSYLLHHGEIPDGMFVCHSCDVPGCVNPDHLWVGTCADNNADRDEKGRHTPLRGSLNGQVRLTESDVQAMRNRYQSGEASTRKLASEYGISAAHAHRIVAGQRWRHVA